MLTLMLTAAYPLPAVDSGGCVAEVERFVPAEGATDVPLNIQPWSEMRQWCGVADYWLFDLDRNARVQGYFDQVTSDITQFRPEQPLSPGTRYEITVDGYNGTRSQSRFTTGIESLPARVPDVAVTVTNPVLESCSIDGGSFVTWSVDVQAVVTPPDPWGFVTDGSVLLPTGQTTNAQIHSTLAADTPACLDVFVHPGNGELVAETACIDVEKPLASECRTEQPRSECGCSAAPTSAGWTALLRRR